LKKELTSLKVKIWEKVKTCEEKYGVKANGGWQNFDR
jgi:hypothetical protein